MKLFVESSSVWRLCLFFPDNAKLFRIEVGLPKVLALLDWVVRHISLLSKESSQKWHSRHRLHNASPQQWILHALIDTRQLIADTGKIIETEGADESRDGGIAHGGVSRTLLYRRVVGFMYKGGLCE